MLKVLGIISLVAISTFLSIFAISNDQSVTIDILTFKISAPIYIFIFINSFLFFIIGGICGTGYNIIKDYKIFRLKNKIKKISDKEYNR